MTEQIRTVPFGRYVLERLLSRGGMGEIYLARTEGPGGFRKHVIIKKLLPHLADDPEFVNRFVDEARIATSLTHGNILPVFDLGRVDGEYFIAMEYLPGRDLRDMLKRYAREGERMPLAVAAYVIEEVSRGLAYAHKKASATGEPLHIVHRDVSPSNILVSSDGVVKLTDFGIAKATSRLGRSITGRLQGKFCYMSPEQAAGRSVDARSDVFSLATVAYEVLTGVRPFEAESDIATLERVRAAEVAPPSRHRPELSAEVDEVLLAALARDPEERVADAAELGRALSNALGGRSTAAQMAAQLSRLFPGEEAEFGATGSNLDFDEVLALQAERAFAGDGERTRTRTASSPGQSGPWLQVGDGAGSLPTPTPAVAGALFTPQPGRAEEAPAGQARRLRASTWAALLGLVGAVAVTVLFVSPGLLRPAHLRVACSAASAEVYVDNVFRGLCPVRLEVPAGERVVSARLVGFAPAEATVEARRGEERAVSLVLDAVPTPERGAVGGTVVLGAGPQELAEGPDALVDRARQAVALATVSARSADLASARIAEVALANLRDERGAREERERTRRGGAERSEGGATARPEGGPEAGPGPGGATAGATAGATGQGSGAPTHRVTVWLDYPARGTLYVDGREVGDAPMTLDLPVGVYEFELVNEALGVTDRQRVRVEAQDGELQVPMFGRQPR
jgi:tRNA A-37 threonylcarbamoyl transferase component Bud32